MGLHTLSDLRQPGRYEIGHQPTQPHTPTRKQTCDFSVQPVSLRSLSRCHDLTDHVDLPLCLHQMQRIVGVQVAASKILLQLQRPRLSQ